MFPTSTHCRHWMLGTEKKARERRMKVHDDFIAKQGPTGTKYLTFEDSETLLRFFQRKLAEFCCKFQPPMPKNVTGTAAQYYKRFYLNNSVMDYHPKEILVTAAYLACKVEEFNVTMEQYVSNINGNKERATDIILNHELLLMSELNFQLTVHNPWRAAEGMLIDIKTRLLPQIIATGQKMHPESFRPEMERFLDDAVSFTNACLIYAPSQIALAAVIHGASKSGHNLDSYVTDVLFAAGDDHIANIIEAVRNIRLMVKNMEDVPSMGVIKDLCDRLERCRNQDNNPDSQAYKRKIMELLDDDEDRMAKMARLDHSTSMPSGISAIPQ